MNRLTIFRTLLAVTFGLTVGSAAGQEMGKAEQLSCTWPDLDSVKMEVSSKLNALVGGHVLDEKEATRFQNKLAATEAVESKLKPTHTDPSLVQFISLLQDLRQLNARIDMVMEKKLETGAAIDAKLAQLDSEVEEERQQKKINEADYSRLKTGLNDIAQVESAFKTTYGAELKGRQVQTLAEQMDKVRSDFAETLFGVRDKPILDRKLIEIEKQIADCRSNGQITAAEATSYNQSLNQVRALEESFQDSDDGLTAQEVMVLAGELDECATRLHQSASKR